MKRRPDFYEYMYVVPAWALLLILPVIHLFPPLSGHKAVLGQYG